MNLHLRIVGIPKLNYNPKEKRIIKFYWILQKEIN